MFHAKALPDRFVTLMTHSTNTGSGSEGGAPETTSTSLLRRAKAQEPAAWRRLAKIYGPLIYRWCREAGLQGADAADVVQDVFVAAARGVADFRGGAHKGSFRAWLRTITWNKVRDHFRRRRGLPPAKGGTGAQQALLEIPELPEPSSASDPAEVDAALWRRTLEFVQAEFEDRTCRAFMQVVLQRRPPADVAAELGMRVDAVYQAKSRVLRRLRQELGDLEEAD